MLQGFEGGGGGGVELGDFADGLVFEGDVFVEAVTCYGGVVGAKHIEADACVVNVDERFEVLETAVAYGFVNG